MAIIFSFPIFKLSACTSSVCSLYFCFFALSLSQLCGCARASMSALAHLLLLSWIRFQTLHSFILYTLHGITLFRRMWFWCFFPFLISHRYEKWWKYFCSPEEKSENWSGSLGMRARVKLGIFGFFPMTRICAWKSRQNIPNVLYFIRTEGVLVHASTSSIKMKLSFHSLLLLRSMNFTFWLE